MSDNILDRVKKVVKEELNVQDEVSESASFTDDLAQTASTLLNS